MSEFTKEAATAALKGLQNKTAPTAQETVGTKQDLNECDSQGCGGK